MATIQIRVDEKTKQSAKRVLDTLGIDMSTAIKIYLKQIILKKGVPLSLTTKNGLTTQEERYIVKAATEAKKGKNITKPLPPKDAIQHLIDISGYENSVS